MLREEECVILQVPTLRYLNFVFNYNIILHYKDNMPKSACNAHYLTCRGRCACSSILAVVPALVNLTTISSIIRLAATLGLLVGIQETAAAVHTLDQAGTTGRSCRQ